MKEIKRRLAAIMFTDMVGYSAMMQRDETVANRLRDRHRDVFTRNTEKHGGKILQYYGDGTLSIYPSATAAVECAVDIQRELKEEPQVPLRIGIHTGDISYSNEDVFGDGVNIAARIESECIPGGIYISGKVYDDLKNHAVIKAQPLGKFQLKNIQQEVDLYGVSNRGITVPEQRSFGSKVTSSPPASMLFENHIMAGSGRRKKSAAGLLGIFFGMFGVHRFYLGQRKLGLIYLGITLTAMFILTFLDRLIGLMAIVGAIDGIVLWTMSKDEFNAKYNQPAMPAQEQVARPVAHQPPAAHPLHQQFENFKSQAVQEFNKFDYKRAIESLRRASELKNDDPQVHFLLACCYSVFEETEKALLHLDTAVAFGWEDQERIREQYELAHLREQPVFKTFERNEYRLPKELPLPSDTQLQLKQDTDPDLLEQLNKLQQLRREGVLDEGEYLRLKVAMQAQPGGKKP